MFVALVRATRRNTPEDAILQCNENSEFWLNNFMYMFWTILGVNRLYFPEHVSLMSLWWRRDATSVSCKLLNVIEEEESKPFPEMFVCPYVPSIAVVVRITSRNLL
jgi:hypothetical protein